MDASQPRRRCRTMCTPALKKADRSLVLLCYKHLAATRLRPQQGHWINVRASTRARRKRQEVAIDHGAWYCVGATPRGRKAASRGGADCAPTLAEHDRALSRRRDDAPPGYGTAAAVPLSRAVRAYRARTKRSPHNPQMAVRRFGCPRAKVALRPPARTLRLLRSTCFGASHLP